MDEMNARLTPNREQINGTLEADNQPMSASLMMSRTYNTPTYLSDLGDVTITSPQNEQVLQYDGSKWVNGTVEGGGSSYTNLTNKPKINNVELSGNKTGAQLGLASASDIPTKTSDLTNDSKFISDSDYNHTDNNFTDDEKTKLNGLESVSWTQNTTSGTKIASINIGGTSTDVYAPTSGGGGSTDYSELTSKPKINNVELAGNKTSSDLGLANETHTHTKSQITDMISKTSELTNDSNFISDANYTHIDVTDTYSSTSSDAMSGKAVASAIENLDVAAIGGNGSVITKISETDGKISANSSTLTSLVDGTNVVVSNSQINLSSGITTKLSKLDTDTTATNGQALAWNGTKFTPTTINVDTWYSQTKTATATGDQTITFTGLTTTSAYELWFDTSDGSQVTVKSSSLSGTTMSYVVNIPSGCPVPVSFKLREIK